MSQAGTVSLMVVRRGCDDPRYGLKFSTPLLGPVDQLLNIFPLCLSDVDVGDIYLFLGWVHVCEMWE